MAMSSDDREVGIETRERELGGVKGNWERALRSIYILGESTAL